MWQKFENVGSTVEEVGLGKTSTNYNSHLSVLMTIIRFTYLTKTIKDHLLIVHVNCTAVLNNAVC